MCSTFGMRDARPGGLDLSLAAIYEGAEEEGFSGDVNHEKEKSRRRGQQETKRCVSTCSVCVGRY